MTELLSFFFPYIVLILHPSYTITFRLEMNLLSALSPRFLSPVKLFAALLKWLPFEVPPFSHEVPPLSLIQTERYPQQS